MKISACLICFNEERWIERALRSLQWADEILVVDAFSTDRTVEIAQKYATRVIQRAWNGFAEQRQFAIDQAQHDWIFVLDADEFCTAELIQRMKAFQALPHDPPFYLYKVHRKEHLMGMPYRYGSGNPSFQDRFFHRKYVRYVGEVHEYPYYEGPYGVIRESIYHDSFSSLEEMVEKMNRYTSLEAKAFFEKGKRSSWLRAFFSGMAQFFRSYFLRKGFLDGPAGLFLAVFDGMSFFLRRAKLWTLWYEKERKRERMEEKERV